ncbi:MAG: glycosyltransferase family 4 protein [Betaproteobacteria bacterium]
MHVCVLTSVHLPFDIRIFYKECKTLTLAGYKVVLVAPHDRDEVVDGVRVRAVPKPRSRRERMMRTVWQVYRAAILENAQLYHVHDPELIPVGVLLRLHGKRVVYDMHENVPKAILSKGWIRPWVRPILSGIVKAVERVLLNGMPVIYAEKSYAKDYPWVKPAVTVQNMPLLSSIFAIEESKYPIPTVGYLGGVTPERGSLVYLEALRILKERGHTVGWECIGPVSEEHRAELIHLCSRYGLEHVYLRGYMLPDQGWRHVARCKIGLAVLKAIPNYIGSYPTKMFEYMALGLPVIVSDFPLYRDIVEKEQCGICVDPESPVAVADAIQRILTHPDMARVMGERGREAVRERYNWDAEAKKLLDFYDRLLVSNES